MLVVIGLTGCGMSRGQVDKIALRNFEKKYGVDCEVRCIEKITDSVEHRDEIHVYVPELMEEYESAIIYSWKDDNVAVSSDNLFEFVVRDEVESAFTEICDKYFESIKAYTTFVSSSFDNSLGLTSTLEDAYNVDEKMIASTYVIVYTGLSEFEFQQYADRVADELKSENIFSSITFYPVSNLDEFDSITRENCQDKVDLFSRDSVVDMPYDAYENYSYDIEG